MKTRDPLFFFPAIRESVSDKGEPTLIGGEKVIVCTLTDEIKEPLSAPAKTGVKIVRRFNGRVLFETLSPVCRENPLWGDKKGYCWAGEKDVA